MKYWFYHYFAIHQANETTQGSGFAYTRREFLHIKSLCNSIKETRDYYKDVSIISYREITEKEYKFQKEKGI